MTLVFSSDEVEKQVNRIARDTLADVSIPGFRKGKVPMNVLKERFADELYYDAILELVESRLAKELDSKNIRPLEYPRFQDYCFVKESNTYEAYLVYEDSIGVQEATLKDEKIIIPTIQLSEQDVDDTIALWKSMHPAYEAVDGPMIDESDEVNLEFTLFVDGEIRTASFGEVNLYLIALDKPIEEYCIGMYVGEHSCISIDKNCSPAFRDPKDRAAFGIEKNASVEFKVRSIHRPNFERLSAAALSQLGVLSEDEPEFRSFAKEQIESEMEWQKVMALWNQTSIMILNKVKYNPSLAEIKSRIWSLMSEDFFAEEKIAEAIAEQFDSELYKSYFYKSFVRTKLDAVFERLGIVHTYEPDYLDMVHYMNLASYSVRLEDQELDFDFIDDFDDEYDEYDEYDEEWFPDDFDDEHGDASQSYEDLGIFDDEDDLFDEYDFERMAAEYHRYRLIQLLLEEASRNEVSMGLADFELWQDDCLSNLPTADEIFARYASTER